MKKKLIFIILITALVSIFATFMIVIPITVQQQLNSNLEFRPAQNSYTINHEEIAPCFNVSIYMPIHFKIPAGVPFNYKVTVNFQWKVEMNYSVNEAVRATYVFTCNGKEDSAIQEDFVGLKGACLFGSNPAKEINPISMQQGANVLVLGVIVATIDQDISNPSTEICSFNLEISEIRLSLIANDLDDDGILDPIDPIVGLNNYTTLLIVSLLSVPVLTISYKIVPKKLSDN